MTATTVRGFASTVARISSTSESLSRSVERSPPRDPANPSPEACPAGVGGSSKTGSGSRSSRSNPTSGWSAGGNSCDASRPLSPSSMYSPSSTQVVPTMTRATSASRDFARVGDADDRGEGVAQCVQGDRHLGRVHVARSSVAQVLDAGERSDDGESRRRVEGEDAALVAEKDDRLLRHPPRQAAVCITCDDIHRMAWSANTGAKRRKVATVSVTRASTSVIDRVPSSSASASEVARCWLNGISMLRPASTDFTGSRSPKMKSEVT